MVIHPVLRHNRGPKVELCMAEEAIGLARSLDWDIIYTPQLIEFATKDFEEFVP